MLRSTMPHPDSKCTPEQEGLFGWRSYEALDVVSDVIVPGFAWALAWTLARLVANVLIIYPLSRKAVLGRWTAPTLVPGAADELKLRKFREAAWRCIVYSVNCVLGAYVLLYHDGGVKSWVSDPQQVIEGWPEAHVPTPDMQLMYAVGFGLYAHQLHGVLTDVRLKDFGMMLTHHIVSLVLVVFSWYNRYHRAGCIVFLIHDFSDIFLEGAKCFNYAKARYRWAKLAADVFFGIFALSFYYLRLGVYPYRVLYIAWTRGCEICACWPEPFPGGYGCGLKFWGVFGIFSSLTVLQFIWGLAIAKVLYNVLILGEEPEDVRDDEGDIIEELKKRK